MVRKRRLTSIVALLVLAGALATGCGSSSDGSGTNTVSSGSSQSSSEQKQEEPALGTRQNPVPIGTEVEVGPNWHVQLLEVNPDAWSVIQSENMFNTPPEEGKQYVMAKFKFSYAGAESGTPWVDLSLRYLGNDGNTYSSGDCGVIPQPYTDIGEQFPGASAEGNVCWAVPSSAISGGSIIVEETFSFEDTRVFFAGAQ
ncbi:MAG TPA: hypothetical protein VIL07_08040 [Symbiobacteriaceae bacterium]